MRRNGTESDKVKKKTDDESNYKFETSKIIRICLSLFAHPFNWKRCETNWVAFIYAEEIITSRSSVLRQKQERPNKKSRIWKWDKLCIKIEEKATEKKNTKAIVHPLEVYRWPVQAQQINWCRSEMREFISYKVSACRFRFKCRCHRRLMKKGEEKNNEERFVIRCETETNCTTLELKLFAFIE